jgi:hypothetical protein
MGRVIVIQDANFADILILPKLPEGTDAHAAHSPALGS